VEKALLLQPVAVTVLYVDVHVCADADDDAFLFEGMPVDPNFPLQHFYPETLRTYYQVLSSRDLLDLQHVSPLLLVSAFIICAYVYIDI